jgi:hypothetical protein
MTLTSPSRIPLAKEFVRLGFGDVIDDNAWFRSLEFLTEKLTTIEAQQVIPVLRQYNLFNGESVASAVGRFRGRVMGWQFGRARSPLLIVALAPWTHQIEDTPLGTLSGRRFTDMDNKKLIDELRSVFLNELNAAEFKMNGSNDLEYGAWWD